MVYGDYSSIHGFTKQNNVMIDFYLNECNRVSKTGEKKCRTWDIIFWLVSHFIYFNVTVHLQWAHLSGKRNKMKSKCNSQGARFLKIDLAQLSSQKRFDFRNSYYYPSTTFLGTSYSQIVAAVFKSCSPKVKMSHPEQIWVQ